MAFSSAELEAGMHGFKGFDAIGFGDHATGSDFTRGDQFDVHARFGKEAEHASCRSCGGRHPSTNRADAGYRRTILENGTGPLGQERCERLIRGCPVFPFHDEADVTAAIAVLPFGLNDRIKADAGIRER